MNPFIKINGRLINIGCLTVLEKDQETGTYFINTTCGKSIDTTFTTEIEWLLFYTSSLEKVYKETVQQNLSYTADMIKEFEDK